MKKNLLFMTASLLALGIASQASAADLRAAPAYSKAPPMVAAIYDWSGLYIGINGGGGSAHSSDDWSNSARSTGGTVGGQLGYRWQVSNWVFGVEAQGNWADFGKKDGWHHVDNFSLYTGQIGYAWNNVLWYVKGGASLVNNSWYWGDRAASYYGASGQYVGETVGTGLEIGFAPNWSVGIEYNHIFMDKQDLSWGLTTVKNTVRADMDVGLVRLNYRFGGPVVARY